MEQLCSTPPPPDNNYINILAEYFARLSFLVRFSLFFPLAHSPKRQPCVAWLTVFREKSRWKPAQAYRKVNLPYPCLSRPHGVFPKRRKGTGTFPQFPYL